MILRFLRALVAAVSLVFWSGSMSLAEEASQADAPGLAVFDTNGNGIIDEAEATPEFLNHINKAFMVRAPEPASKIPAETEEIPVKLPVVAAAVSPRVLRSMLLRRAVEEVSLTHSAAELDAADGAVVSYINDVRQGTEEWQVQGALLYPVRYETGREIVAGNRTLSAYTFVPSASFDRKFHSSDLESEINNLVFRLGSEWEVSGGKIFPKQYFRLSPVYGTDFEFESSVVAGEFQYEVLKKSWGLGATRPCFLGRFRCQWRTILHVEGGKTLDAGNKTNLVDDEEFLRIGPKLNITLQPDFAPFKRLEMKAGWVYLEDVLGDSGATDLFETGISWRLDDKGHLRMRAQYRHGDLPLTRDKITIVTTGLEIKF
jgi:hypothetical protein